MVNPNQTCNAAAAALGSPPNALPNALPNTLRAWRKSLRPATSMTEAALWFGVSVVGYRAWELWPMEGEGRMPSPSNWLVIGRVTKGAVTANDFIKSYEEAA